MHICTCEIMLFTLYYAKCGVCNSDHTRLIYFHCNIIIVLVYYQRANITNIMWHNHSASSTTIVPHGLAYHKSKQ